MKKLICICALVLALCGFLFFAIFSASGGAKGDIDPETNVGVLDKASIPSTQMAFEKDLVSLKKEHFWNFNPTFTNYVGGYSFELPHGLKFTDFENNDERAVFGNEDTRLEVYHQYTDVASEYAGYSYMFLNDKKNHHLIQEKEFKNEEGYEVFLKEWKRTPLKRVEKDLPHYLCLDLVKGKNVYSFFLSSSREEGLDKMADELLKHFKAFKPTKKPELSVHKSGLRANLNAETKAVYKKYFSPDSPLVWGIFPSNINVNGFTDFGPLKEMEANLNCPGFKFLLDYIEIRNSYGKDQILKRLQNCYKEGRIVELTLQPKLYDMIKEPNRIYDMLNGKYDKGLRSFAKQVATFGHPVLFRPLNEMNGDWCSYNGLWASRDPQVYVEFYRYLYRIFEEEGALANTLWVWNPNEKSFPDFAWNKASSYYPGDEYVDLVGLTGYNTGDYYEGETWRTFKEIYTPIYKDMSARYQQPFLITEFSCSKIGGDKAKWVSDMFKDIEKFPRIKVAIWWHGCDFDEDGTVSRPYSINDSPELGAVFRQYFAEHKNS